jgi:hypothetical protein
MEIIDQAESPEWHKVMVDANIEIFEMSYEDSVIYFKSWRRSGAPTVQVLRHYQ